MNIGRLAIVVFLVTIDAAAGKTTARNTPCDADIRGPLKRFVRDAAKAGCCSDI
jgi:hypothetical protein